MTMPDDYSPACLLSNNARWADDVKEVDPQFFLKRSTASEEPEAEFLKPKVLYIGCSDWRVPESAVSSIHPGGVFVHRNIANQFHLNDDSALSVLAYAVENLHVSQIIVAGHTLCGGAEAALKHWHSTEPVLPAGSPLARWLARLTETAEGYEPGDLTKLIEANVRVQINNIVQTDVVQAAWARENEEKKGKNDLQVHGWVYELETGRMRDLGISVGRTGKVSVPPA